MSDTAVSNTVRSRLTLVLAVSVPVLLCGIIGLTHPMRLTASTAEHWRVMHLVLIPIFPLIGLAPWLIARRAGRGWGIAGAILGYGFAAFYTSLDILAGVAAGVLVGSGHPDATGPIYALARVLAAIGVVSLVLGCVVAAVAAFRIDGPWALLGGLIAAVGAGLLLPGHIYLGLGTVATALVALGFVILALRVTAAPRAQPA